jgi:hypothetical protein
VGGMPNLAGGEPFSGGRGEGGELMDSGLRRAAVQRAVKGRHRSEERGATGGGDAGRGVDGRASVTWCADIAAWRGRALGDYMSVSGDRTISTSLHRASAAFCGFPNLDIVLREEQSAALAAHAIANGRLSDRLDGGDGRRCRFCPHGDDTPGRGEHDRGHREHRGGGRRFTRPVANQHLRSAFRNWSWNRNCSASQHL